MFVIATFSSSCCLLIEFRPMKFPTVVATLRGSLLKLFLLHDLVGLMVHLIVIGTTLHVMGRWKAEGGLCMGGGGGGLLGG